MPEHSIRLDLLEALSLSEHFRARGEALHARYQPGGDAFIQAADGLDGMLLQMFAESGVVITLTGELREDGADA